MKTIFKNFTFGLVITMLITSSFISQANSTFTNLEELSTKLVKSKVFEKFTLNTSTIFLANFFHKQSLSAEQIKAEEELMANYQKRLDLIFPEKLEMAQMMGFESWEQYVEKIDHSKKLRISLFLEFPELSMLSTDDLKKVMEKAISQIDIAAKLEENKELSDCLEKAANTKANCLRVSTPYYLRTLAVFLTAACIGVAFRIYVVGAAILIPETDGASAVAAASAWTAYFGIACGICTTLAVATFGGAEQEKYADRSECHTTFGADNAVCAIRYK